MRYIKHSKELNYLVSVCKQVIRTINQTNGNELLREIEIQPVPGGRYKLTAESECHDGFSAVSATGEPITYQIYEKQDWRVLGNPLN